MNKARKEENFISSTNLSSTPSITQEPGCGTRSAAAVKVSRSLIMPQSLEGLHYDNGRLCKLNVGLTEKQTHTHPVRATLRRIQQLPHTPTPTIPTYSTSPPRAVPPSTFTSTPQFLTDSIPKSVTYHHTTAHLSPLGSPKYNSRGIDTTPALQLRPYGKRSPSSKTRGCSVCRLNLSAVNKDEKIYRK